MVISSLRKDNAYLKKALAELSHQHSEHNKLVERFLSLETMRLETYQLLAAKDKKISMPSEQQSKKEENLMDICMRMKRSISSYAQETEEIRNQIVNLSTRCQYLKDKVAGKKDSISEELVSADDLSKLRNHLSDALEKNKQWLEYDQQREAYVRSILARMLWLERQLNEANQARSQRHNEDHSDDKEQIRQMQEQYEGLLQEAKDELEVLGEHVHLTQQSLITAQKQCEEKESEVEELRQQLEAERRSGESEPEDHHCPDSEACLSDENEDLQSSLDAERRRSSNFELQDNLSHTLLLNRYHADQERIADLERQLKICSQDLEDVRQDCSYLKKHLVRVLKMLPKAKDRVTTHPQANLQDCSSCEVAHPSSVPPRDRRTSSRHSSSVNESFLECPVCQAQYPVCHYRELMSHLEGCIV